jgi:hypothetical protein
MFVYSKKILAFTHEIKDTIRRILTHEIRLKCAGRRFYNKLQTRSYPIHVIIYNHKSMLGYFDPHFYELGFHECLMRVSKEQLTNIIRHELAHYVTFTKHGGTILPHAPEFRDFCKSCGWGEEVYNATTELEFEPAAIEESAVLRKVQKLMALGSSSEPHEAEQAMIKSRQLLLKHNLEAKEPEEDTAKVAMQRILQQKRESAKMRAIASIVKTFFVGIVYHRGEEYTTLEIIGDPVNVEIGEYVAKVLEIELENLWLQAQKTARLKGATAKNSFFLGVAKGYCQKVEALKKEHTANEAKALIVMEKQLLEAQDMVYARLSSKTSSARYCPSSGKQGEKMGRMLNINPAIAGRAKEAGRLLGFFKKD